MYDYNQLIKDLELILRARGSRMQTGYFIFSLYRDDLIELSCMIIGDENLPKNNIQLQLKDDRGVFVFQQLNFIEIDTPLAQHILKIVTEIEEHHVHSNFSQQYALTKK